jgi:MFS family permease
VNPPATAHVSATAPAPAANARYKWELVGWLWLAYFLNQGDRQIYNAVLPLIRADLGASDVQLGLVATLFTLFYGVLVPVAGVLGDRWSRKWIICASLLVFSAGTLLTGLAGGLVGLIVFRSIATGAGEAFYYPAANTLIGLHHRETRAQAMAIHQTSVYVGVVASSVLAAWIGEQHGWRAAFYVFGGGGIVLAALLAWRLRNDTPAADAPRAAGEGLRASLAAILRVRTFYFLSFAFGAMVFVNVGFTTWMPTFLYERFALSLKTAAFQAVFLHLLFAFFGVMIGGRISDRLAARRSTIRIQIEWIGLLAGAPFIFLLGAAPELWIVYVALAGFGLFRGLYDSNLFAALFDVIEPRHRSTATGLMLAFAFTVGATAPLLLGYLKPQVGLSTGLSALALAYALGGVALLMAQRTCFPREFRRETA